MKILKLNIKNINSLKGEQTIDFEKYFQNSLFLITGETGSGKTTIFDAICIALYNQTPRLKDTKEVLTKRTTDGYIELIYEVNGEIYKNSWFVKRSRNKIDGKIQDTKMELAIQKNGKFEILSTKKTEVLKKTAEIIKLNFGQFRKSVLLAQGDFNAFLNANSNERADILEKMTGTKIYAEIGKKTFELYKEKKNEIEQLKAQIEIIPIIKEEELQNRKIELKELENRVNLVVQTISEIENKIKILDKKEGLEKEIESFKNSILETENNIKILENNKNIQQNRVLEYKDKMEEFLKEFQQKMEFFNKIEKIDTKITIFENRKKEILKRIQSIDSELKQKNIVKEKEGENIELEKEIQYFEAKIVVLKFEKERGELKENTPCPLCGSTIHPYKDKFKNEKLEKIKLELNNLKKRLKQNNSFIDKYSGIFEKLESEKNGLKKELGELEKDIIELIQQKNGETFDKNKKLELENDKKKKENFIKEQQEKLDDINTNLKIALQNREFYNKNLQQKEGELNKLNSVQENREKLQSELKNQKLENQKLNQSIGELRKQIKIDEDNLEKRKIFDSKIEEKEREIQPYSILNELIGSADGAKFRKFAQSLTLNYLLNLANQHLKILNKRYILEKSDELDIVVIDKYHLNEKRVIKSLSGGESFLVSLALAFALSDMVSSKIGIESFFLDEGFGSLDSTTLYDAISALNKIQNSGKMIGIISHVENLKEEIPLQIQLKSTNGVGKIKIII